MLTLLTGFVRGFLWAAALWLAAFFLGVPFTWSIFTLCVVAIVVSNVLERAVPDFSGRPQG